MYKRFQVLFVGYHKTIKPQVRCIKKDKTFSTKSCTPPEKGVYWYYTTSKKTNKQKEEKMLTIAKIAIAIAGLGVAFVGSTDAFADGTREPFIVQTGSAGIVITD